MTKYVQSLKPDETKMGAKVLINHLLDGSRFFLLVVDEYRMLSILQFSYVVEEVMEDCNQIDFGEGRCVKEN